MLLRDKNMTKQDLAEKYRPEIREILEKQWFNIFVWQTHPSQVKLDGEITAEQATKLAFILNKVDEEKKNLS
jgi:hypothetical protein